MDIYTPKSKILCSCIICKKQFSHMGIHSHYATAHTKEGNERIRKANSKGSKLGSLAHNKLKRQRIEDYNLNPNKCTECNIKLPYETRNHKFCSKSCSATYSNKRRTPPSNETRAKTSNSLKRKYTPKNLEQAIKPIFSKICYCKICNKLFETKSYSTKTCSDECKKQLLSLLAINRIKINRRSNYRRDKKSFLEDSFEKWLVLNKIFNYHTEYTIRNHITNQWYFVDFYFPKFNLIVELDGKQHEKESHKIKDKIREEYITNHLGINVFRISHKEYIEKSKINSLLEIMVPREGNAPSFTV